MKTKINDLGLLPDNAVTLYQFNRIHFWLNGQEQIRDIPPAMSTLDYLHHENCLFGTKCSCNEGDCGACTVVIAYLQEGAIRYEAINSCLYPMAKMHGKHLITIESLGTPEALHPIQQAMLDYRGTQCGYCTPGFVMSLFALLVTQLHPDSERILAALEGNLCRCTGYDSILKAALYLSEKYDIKGILPAWCREVEPLIFGHQIAAEYVCKTSNFMYHTTAYYVPRNLSELFGIQNEITDYKYINGGTDIMVQINISRAQYPVLIDLSELQELNGIYLKPDGIHIGANVTYSDVLESGIIKADLPALPQIIAQIASEQIRNFGTLSGNIGNASPVADSIPTLLAHKAILKLVSAQGERTLPLDPYYLDYKKTDLQPGEIIHSIIVPRPAKGSFQSALKASKRKSVDISSVSTAIHLQVTDSIITEAILALGGVAKTPVISKMFSSLLIGKSWTKLEVEHLAQSVAAEFQPISDVRGSEQYRTKMIHNHVLIYITQATEYFAIGGQA
ncbi:MAG: xanthine dehydrogenase [Candidatus Cloacimonetes bacterium HGW-Cloacimonetes-1]|nr:MAG: xanthine dehydrogenase [Candidatus Cloacimonetes bacterium HGW-Cloacimonetes-1]